VKEAGFDLATDTMLLVGVYYFVLMYLEIRCDRGDLCVGKYCRRLDLMDVDMLYNFHFG